MSTQQPKAKKALVKLPFPMPSAQDDSEDVAHNQVRPKPEQYADRTWMPPRGVYSHLVTSIITVRES